MGVPITLIMWIEDYLSNRHIRTKVNNCVSSSRSLLCGVPQGSIIGPTLFLCYINDLAISLRNKDTNISLYADDAVIYCSDKQHSRLKTHLETLLTEIHCWSKRNFININVQKTKFCIYGYRSCVKKFQDVSICSGGQHIHRCQQYNYLGVLLDECMTLQSNFNCIFKKFSLKIYQFGKIRKYVDRSTRILIYKQTILPLVEYVSFMLYLNTTRDVEKLQKLQNRCLRLCLDIVNPRDVSIEHLHRLSKVNTLEIRRDIQLLNLMFLLKTNNKFHKESQRNTRSAERYVFDTNIVHMDVYAKSPYIKGVSLWNMLPNDTQALRDGHVFKSIVKKDQAIF